MWDFYFTCDMNEPCWWDLMGKSLFCIQDKKFWMPQVLFEPMCNFDEVLEKVWFNSTDKFCIVFCFVLFFHYSGLKFDSGREYKDNGPPNSSEPTT